RVFLYLSRSHFTKQFEGFEALFWCSWRGMVKGSRNTSPLPTQPHGLDLQPSYIQALRFPKLRRPFRRTFAPPLRPLGRGPFRRLSCTIPRPLVYYWLTRNLWLD